MSGKVIWITGLSGAGKTTLATELVSHLRDNNETPVLLDGDIFRDLLRVPNLMADEYSREVRISLSLKYGLMCKLLASQGITVVIATISMFEEIYTWNRNNLPNYFEVYLKVPLKELRARDPKSIYRRYDDGRICNVAGLDLEVDEPYRSHLTLDFETQPDIWESEKTLAKYLISNLS